MTEPQPTPTPTPTPTQVVAGVDNATIPERLVIIGIFGALAIIALWQDNLQAATGFASTIGVYFLSRNGA